MRFCEVHGRFLRGSLTCAEAAELLGMSERNFLCYRNRYEAEGAARLYDKRVGRASFRRAPVDEATRVIELYATKYFDFNVRHFHETLRTRHGFKRSYTWTKRVPERVFVEGALLAGISLQGPFWSLGVYNGSGVGRVKPA